MKPGEAARVRRRLEAYAADAFGSLARPDQRRHRLDRLAPAVEEAEAVLAWSCWRPCDQARARRRHHERRRRRGSQLRL